MNNSTDLTTMKCIALLIAHYPPRNETQVIQPPTIKAYIRALSDFDPVQLEMACLEHIRSSKWFPSVHELRDAYANISIKAMGVISSSEAWGKVSSVITGGGRCQRSDFSELTWQVIKDVGGWSMLKHSTMPASDRARFINAYDTRLKREKDDMTMMPVVRDYIGNLTAGMKQLPEPEQEREMPALLPDPFTEGNKPNIPQAVLDRIRVITGKMTVKSERAS